MKTVDSSPVETEKKSENPPHPDTGPEVDIFVNGAAFQIHRGHTLISEIKAAAGVPAAFELELVEKSGLEPLSDSGAVTLKGGERFSAHPRSGQVS